MQNTANTFSAITMHHATSNLRNTTDQKFLQYIHGNEKGEKDPTGRKETKTAHIKALLNREKKNRKSGNHILPITANKTIAPEKENNCKKKPRPYINIWWR